MARDFKDWFSSFRESINQYDYYTDFEKAYENVDKLKVEINILNALIASKNIEKEFADLIKRYPEVLKAIPILLAVREYEIYCQDENGAILYRFDKTIQSVEQYAYFMRQTGLFDLMENHIISNLYDYVTGVEVGLGSNGRKNRGGHQMEDLVEKYIVSAGYELNKTYFKEMYLSEVEHKWGVDLSSISAEGTTAKRFDFVIKTDKKIYLIETNFYSSGGSKLNETARSYKTIALEASQIPNVDFLWVTDGAGWKSAKSNLEETYKVLVDLYNIKDMESGLFERLKGLK